MIPQSHCQSLALVAVAGWFSGRHVARCVYRLMFHGCMCRLVGRIFVSIGIVLLAKGDAALSGQRRYECIVVCGVYRIEHLLELSQLIFMSIL